MSDANDYWGRWLASRPEGVNDASSRLAEALARYRRRHPTASPAPSPKRSKPSSPPKRTASSPSSSSSSPKRSTTTEEQRRQQHRDAQRRYKAKMSAEEREAWLAGRRAEHRAKLAVLTDEQRAERRARNAANARRRRQANPEAFLAADKRYRDKRAERKASALTVSSTTVDERDMNSTTNADTLTTVNRLEIELFRLIERASAFAAEAQRLEALKTEKHKELVAAREAEQKGAAEAK